MSETTIGTLRVTSQREGGLQANSTELVIPCDRRCPVFGNRHVLHNHNDPVEREKVINAFRIDLDNDFEQKGPIYKKCKDVAEKLKRGQNVALECWCTVPPPAFVHCHAHLIEAKILSMLVSEEEPKQEEQLVLTEDQAKALVEIEKSLKQGRSHLLAGYAGTGKSFICKYLAKAYNNVLFTAPTNKAAKVLSKDMGIGTATTIHKALGLQFNKGKLTQVKKVSFHQYDFVVVDECSMIDNDMYQRIKTVIEPECPVLFIGDPAQLPPVKEQDSQTFNTPNYSELEQIVRQGADNPIIAYSLGLREKGFSKYFIPVDGNYIQYATPANREEWMKLIRENCAMGGVYAAWTNARVDLVNQAVHEDIYGKDATDYCVGENIVLNAPWFTDNGATLGHIGDEFTIKKITKTKHYGLDAWLIDVGFTEMQWGDNVNLEELCLIVVSNKDKPIFKAQLDELAKVKNWADYYTLKERFHEISHTYAYTCHKLQGSSYNNVMVDIEDITKNRNTVEMNRCMYVAITRTRTKVTFL